MNLPKILLAPMSGCTDLAFRLIAREHGAKFCFFEMVDCNSINYNTKSLKDILKTNEKDLPIAAQLVGNDSDKMVEAAKKLCKIAKLSFIDINAACPVKKITKKKAGAYLLKEPKTLYKIIKKMTGSIDIPITVKLRIGYEKSDVKEIVKIAKNCEKSGAAALFVHGRTRAKGYSGEIDYIAIKAIKKNVKIQVFGSGNIFNAELMKKMFDETGCDGVMVARGALGNPWIFEGKTPNFLERKKVLLKHLSYINKYRETGQLGFMRKIALWYLKGFPNAAAARGSVSGASSHEELNKLIEMI